MNRRKVLASAAVGAGILAARGTAVAVGAGRQEGERNGLAGQWVSWEDGYLYPITEINERGHWIIVDDELDPAAPSYAVDPAGWVFDAQVWYRVHAIDEEGLWYDGDDGFVYLVDLD